ncbi:hypothetical protein [Kitasatospora sp. NPDC058046]|uniref:hypothetical protein n=1 Tax=Kitasatospora sp. NPDC058046 TaxID=3346312 RepID=UPI0036D828C6
MLAEYATQLGLPSYLPEPVLSPHDAPEFGVELHHPIRPGTTVMAEIAPRKVALTPRPHLIADVTLRAGDHPIGQVRGAGLKITEGPGTHLAATEAPSGVAVATRRCADGRPARVNEFHMALLAEGDINEALGTPGLALARMRTRLPRGELLMLHRSPDPARPHGEYLPGAAMTTEYDVPKDPWYLRDNGGRAFPLLALLEIALQGAAIVAIAHGLILEHPDQDRAVRNLEGRLTLRHLPDLAGRTVTQRSTLLSHTALPDCEIQRYAFELSVDGQAFCSGETTYGCYAAASLAEPGRPPGPGTTPSPWLHLPQAPPPTARPAVASDARLGTGRLALLDDLAVVFQGGAHGLGYALGTARIDPHAWYFDQHFLHDPVMPGSFGLEMMHQSLRAYLLHSGLLDAMPTPVLTIGTATELAWGYRGQILPSHRTVQAEVHLTDLISGGGKLTARADGALWRDGLRVYQATGLSIVARPGTDHRPTP